MNLMISEICNFLSAHYDQTVQIQIQKIRIKISNNYCILHKLTAIIGGDGLIWIFSAFD
jgi:hypothetical protein